MERADLIKKYEEFVKDGYDFKNSEVADKFRHSLNVAYLMAKYAPVVGADEELAFVIGLLHDIGRFYQIIAYKTFNDQQSFDHAKYGVELLDKNNLYKDFHVLPKNIDIVRVAIYNHNKYSIEIEPKTKEGLLQTKLLRDCDKLAILDQYVKVPIHDIKEEITKEDKISPLILESMEKHILNKYEYVKNGLDEICYYISYIFDINYDCTYLEILSYVRIILDWYRNDARFDIPAKYIENYNLERKKKLC